ncbi:hypothetical protein Pcinc_044394 [Petrolisthes cinctipes]|uniref:Uncharacterized protein n=1 Tax=Petrolisthes cinctipes TaxID=88211 RepID=A0AAE1EFC3_PETCI|nr:hypothetical protein Pcinc_044394 [Petrolisthes cinctipes]
MCVILCVSPRVNVVRRNVSQNVDQPVRQNESRLSMSRTVRHLVRGKELRQNRRTKALLQSGSGVGASDGHEGLCQGERKGMRLIGSLAMCQTEILEWVRQNGPQIVRRLEPPSASNRK